MVPAPEHEHVAQDAVPLTVIPPPEFTFILVLVSVPVKDGLAKGANKFSAACVAVDIGLLISLLLSTIPNPTIAAVIPATVPVKVGLAFGANTLIVDVNEIACNPYMTSLIAIRLLLEVIELPPMLP